jgi:hypothetical protein
MKTQILTILSIILALAMINPSCTKDDEDTQPDLPPLEALSMDFSDFTTFPDTTSPLKSADSYINFVYSFTTVGVWSFLTGLPMIIPVAVYAECLKQTPEYLGDNGWQWSFSVTIATVTYEARLVAKRIDNETFSAKMYVTQTGAYEDFMWFEGIVRYDHTYAEWTMYESAANNVAWLSVVWNKDWVAATSDITYEILKTSSPEFGSYISYGIVDNTDYDAFYTISGSEGSAEIKWNTTTKAGRVKAEYFFDDTEWHCWNESFMDVSCN